MTPTWSYDYIMSNKLCERKCKGEKKKGKKNSKCKEMIIVEAARA